MQQNQTPRLTESLRKGLDSVSKGLWAPSWVVRSSGAAARPVQASSLCLRFYRKPLLVHKESFMTGNHAPTGTVVPTEPGNGRFPGKGHGFPGKKSESRDSKGLISRLSRD